MAVQVAQSCAGAACNRPKARLLKTRTSDEGHDALFTLYRGRFSEQIATASAEAVLARWR